MPPSTSISLENMLLLRDAIAANTSAAGNATGDVLQVVCAWPVSGQYGPGSRILYYFLVATCVLARKAEWLRNACLAAALIFPAVAALHGIVLAAVHVDGAIDMDVFGAFQLCSLGILAAPVTVKLSRTYFDDPGRNTIFLWTILILAGLLSLTVEFFRARTVDCTHDDAGNPIFPNTGNFSYDTMCGLSCSIENGPHSPMRGGSVNNIYVIPAPDRLTFGTATLLAAACCIPAILSLISMWNKILEINWKKRFGHGSEEEKNDESIEGTNGATPEKMRGVNALISRYLSVVEAPVFGAAILAILIIGERNFFSTQVDYQTEPIASIGQWAPIVGTGLAAFGSLYLLFASNTDATKKVAWNEEDLRKLGLTLPNSSAHSIATPPIVHIRRGRSDDNDATVSELEIAPTISRSASEFMHPAIHRIKVAKVLKKIGDYVGTAAPDRFDDSDFTRAKGVYPMIPGEQHRNDDLSKTQEQFSRYWSANGNATPSRAGSIASRAGSPQRVRPPRSPSPGPSAAPRRVHASTLPSRRTSSDTYDPSSSTASPPQRRATLEVPSPVPHSPMRTTAAKSISSIENIPTGPSSPAIVISVPSQTPSSAHISHFNSPDS
ncbi:hypothetical protein BP5796_11321 [Coleophoma crateriformis]|uniref:Uncharacterized protein n=1 Tax=Coleophoma crateriformis TaxID=565419 RepID=A0A3D8QI28_9HELO|nr:hypothetical protein BP5796_11321 [Coleophoma crateriformis]